MLTILIILAIVNRRILVKILSSIEIDTATKITLPITSPTKNINTAIARTTSYDNRRYSLNSASACDPIKIAGIGLIGLGVLADATNRRRARLVFISYRQNAPSCRQLHLYRRRRENY